MNKYIFLTLALLVFTTYVGSKEVVGWVEYVVIYDDDEKITVKAKIDTGAKTTSIHSREFHQFKKNGENWVKFKIINRQGDVMELEKPVVRLAKIKRHFDKKQIRPVIRLGLCVGNRYQITGVNLVDRSGLNYQLLVGREFLKNGTLVDSSITYTKDPDCGKLGVE